MIQGHSWSTILVYALAGEQPEHGLLTVCILSKLHKSFTNFVKLIFQFFTDQGQQQQQQQPGWQQPSAELQSRSDFGGSGGSPCWIPASSGEVPPDAVEGGMDGMLISVN